MPPQRRLRTSSPVIVSPLRVPAELPSDLFSTPSSGRVSTEPATPDSPILHTRALRRERSVHLPHVVLHYDRTENILQPWYWCVYMLLVLPPDSLLLTFSLQAGERDWRASHAV
jgi:hypothetical protein